MKSYADLTGKTIRSVATHPEDAELPKIHEWIELEFTDGSKVRLTESTGAGEFVVSVVEKPIAEPSATLTPQRISDYLASPFHCPYCNSDDISAGELDGDGATSGASQGVECNGCGKRWTDNFTLTSIEEMPS